MPLTSREQIRARGAYAAVEQYPNLAEWAESLPTMLQTNGLLATWAYLLSKDGSAVVLNALSDHLARAESRLGVQPTPLSLFLGWIGEGPTQLTGPRLRMLTEEALAFAAWLKRAGQAAGGE